jgi:hypothetical protein
MAHKEEAFSIQQSAFSERQKLFTAEDAKERKQNQHQHQRPFTAEGAEDTHPQRAKTGLAGGPGRAKEGGELTADRRG